MARPVGAKVQPDCGTNAGEIIRQAMKARGYTLKMMAEDLGYRGVSGIGSTISGRNVRTDVFVRFLDNLGFDVIVKDRNGSNRENVWKVEMNDKEGE